MISSPEKTSVPFSRPLLRGPFPQGELIELQFDLSQEALPNQEFSVKSLEQRVETPEGEVLEARGSDGLIIVAVLGEAIPACFFYTH